MIGCFNLQNLNFYTAPESSKLHLKHFFPSSNQYGGKKSFSYEQNLHWVIIVWMIIIFIFFLIKMHFSGLSVEKLFSNNSLWTYYQPVKISTNCLSKLSNILIISSQAFWNILDILLISTKNIALWNFLSMFSSLNLIALSCQSRSYVIIDNGL